MSINISMEQQHAIELGSDLTERVVGITGGAGTGKTFVLGKIYEELRKDLHAYDIALCAPTGRAAKRVHELTGIPAKTIHRLLEFPTPEDARDLGPDDDPLENKPKRNREFRLKERVVLVDESSMIGPTLYGQLMEALQNTGCIRFFGDNNQLPPVEEDGQEAPFLRVLAREHGNVILSHNFRSDDYIVSNALRILDGRVPIQNARFRIIYCDNPIQQMLQMVTKDFMEMEHQIIMPTRKGKFGTMKANPSLQVKFNGSGPHLMLDRADEKDPILAMRGGDKFLWTKNDYQLNIFNGEIGQVDWVNEEDGSLSLVTPEKELIVPATVRAYSPYHGHAISYDPRRHIDLGYAITTHKSQGSEFKTVIYCISGGQAYLLNRQNLYTAITRAKHQVFIITDRRAMGLSLRKRRL